MKGARFGVAASLLAVMAVVLIYYFYSIYERNSPFSGPPGSARDPREVACSLPNGGQWTWGGYEFPSQPLPPDVIQQDIRWVTSFLRPYGFTGMRAFVNAYFQSERGGWGVHPYSLKGPGSSCGHRPVTRYGYCLSEWDPEYFRRVALISQGIPPQPGGHKKITFTIGHKYQCIPSYVYGRANPAPWCSNIEGIQVQGDWITRWDQFSDAERRWILQEYVRLTQKLREQGVDTIEIYNEALISERYHARERISVIEAFQRLIRELKRSFPDLRLQVNMEPLWEGEKAVLDDAGYVDAWHRLSPDIDYWAIHGLLPQEFPEHSALFHEMARSGKLEISDEGQFCDRYHPDVPVMCRNYCGGELFQKVYRFSEIHNYKIHFEHDGVGYDSMGDLSLIPIWNRRELEEMRWFCDRRNIPKAHIEILDQEKEVVVPQGSKYYVTWGSVHADTCTVTKNHVPVWNGICGLEFERAPDAPGVVIRYDIRCLPAGQASVQLRTTEARCGDRRCERWRGENFRNCRVDCPREPQVFLAANGQEDKLEVKAGEPFTVVWKTRFAHRGCKLLRREPPHPWKIWWTCPSEDACSSGSRSDSVPRQPAPASVYYVMECEGKDSMVRKYLAVLGKTGLRD